METVTVNCRNPRCKGEWNIRVIQNPKGIVSYGWWVVKCNRCNQITDLYIGRDVFDSLLIAGGTVLQRLDSDSFTETHVKEAVKKFSQRA